MPRTSLTLLTAFLTGDGGSDKIVLRDAYVALDGQDISGQARALSVEQERDQVEVTGYGSRCREYMPGEKRATFTLDLWVDDALPLSVRPGSAVLVEVAARRGVAPVSSAVCLVTRYAPLAGAAGDGAAAALEFVAVGPVTETPADTVLYPATDLFPSGALVP